MPADRSHPANELTLAQLARVAGARLPHGAEQEFTLRRVSNELAGSHRVLHVGPDISGVSDHIWTASVGTEDEDGDPGETAEAHELETLGDLLDFAAWVRTGEVA